MTGAGLTRAAMFDLDGCLVDSRVPIAEAFNAGLVAIGVAPLPVERIHPYIGPPLLRSYTDVLASLGADVGAAEAAIAGYRAAYGELSLTHTMVFPGIVDVLTALAPSTALYVVTTKPTEFAVPILRALGLLDRFRGVYGPELTALTEPKSVKLDQALRDAGIPGPRRRSDAWMIGDRDFDIVAGRTCGTATVGVTWGIGSRAELVAAGADAVVDTPEELLALLVP